MRILLTSTAAFVPPRGGSTRSNRVWLEHMAWCGHRCEVVCGAAPASSPEQYARIQQEAGNQGVLLNPRDEDAEIALPSGIRVSAHRNLARRPEILAGHIRRIEPDWVLVSSEDLTHSLLREASSAAAGRIVYLAHTPQFFPFGPESWNPDAPAAARVRDAAAVIVIGHHMADYIRRHLGVEATVIHPPIYGSEPFESYSNFGAGRALMVNPCAVKGLPIFAALSGALPEVRFCALPGWGTTSQDREDLAATENVQTLEAVRRIEEVLERTSVLLVPSLWYEGFGLVVMEAMLRGIPVMASDSGGLLEAKRGTGFVLRVAPIRSYLPDFDEVHMPKPIIPEQDIGEWATGLTALLNDRTCYERESERSREAALDFVYGLRASAMEEFLLLLRPKPSPAKQDLAERVDRLSAEQRALLLARVRSSRGRP